jgi:hypothetical protein
MEKILVVNPDGLSIIFNFDAKMWMGLAHDPTKRLDYACLEVDYESGEGAVVLEVMKELADKGKRPTVHIVLESTVLWHVGVVHIVTEHVTEWINKLVTKEDERQNITPVISQVKELRLIVLNKMRTGGVEPFLRKHRSAGYFRLRVGVVGGERVLGVNLRQFSNELPQLHSGGNVRRQ